MKKGLLIILSGPSGVGKGAVRRVLMENNDMDLAYSISMTTRAPRPLETDGVDYFFVDDETFERNIAEGNLLEHASFVGNKYGTPKDYVEKLRNEGKNVLLEIEVQGAMQVLDKMKGDDIISIFLIPPSMADLEKRIRKRRTEPEEIIQARLKKARSELRYKYDYKYIVLNEIVQNAALEIREIIKKNIELQKQKD
ncbi:MAG: guanylate kinase [Bacilli bacterium]|nr:guanylate kinase [Bacilli bacterium]MCI7622573.1 guanylate kinase [Bacilli bacterium]MDD6226165.1 guanylate kinase [Bacilli bacterium]MDD7375600.1 guanylate kinase [Bacilli bacterium]MDD7549916.1 guanylate kinase [Bacilli bacterium]